MDIVKGLALCGCFIGSFYIWRRERLFVKTTVSDLKEAALNPSIYVDRNSTTTIRRRVISFAVVSVASAGYLLRAAVKSGAYAALLTTSSVQHEVRLGCKSVVITLLLFAGVLVEQYAGGCLPSLRVYWREEPLRFARDLIICPIGEELFFRGVLFDVVAARPLGAQIAVTSLLFSLAHVHHVFSFAANAYRDLAQDQESAKESGEQELSEPTLTARAWHTAFARVGVLSVVTSAFGVLSGLYYTCVCDHSLVATIAAHVTCNAIGAPRFSFLERSTNEAERRWKKWICAAYVLGVASSIALMTRTIPTRCD